MAREGRRRDALVKMVRELAVDKDVDEELAVGAEPARDAAEQRLHVLAVLNHLHRHDAVEQLIVVRMERVDVGRDHAHVLQVLLLRLSFNVLALRVRVGHRRDARERVPARMS